MNFTTPGSNFFFSIINSVSLEMSIFWAQSMLSETSDLLKFMPSLWQDSAENPSEPAPSWSSLTEYVPGKVTLHLH